MNLAKRIAEETIASDKPRFISEARDFEIVEKPRVPCARTRDLGSAPIRAYAKGRSSKHAKGTRRSRPKGGERMKDKARHILKAKARLEKLETRERKLLAVQKTKLAEICGEIMRSKAELYDLSTPESPAT